MAYNHEHFAALARAANSGDLAASRLLRDAALSRESEVGRLHALAGRPMDRVWDWSESYRRAYDAARRELLPR